MIFIINNINNTIMVKKDKRQKRTSIKKERQKLIKEKKKQLQKQDLLTDKKSTKEIDIRLEKETKLYWVRALSGLLSGLIGVLIGILGWRLLIWMICFWFITPFFVSFIVFRYEYNKEKWNWKNIIKPGIGIFFFLFMIVSTITFTLMLFF
jgi:Flp pilus assembly protein TadB